MEQDPLKSGGTSRSAQNVATTCVLSPAAMFATVDIAAVAECIGVITEDCRPSLAFGRCRDERIRSPDALARG